MSALLPPKHKSEGRPGPDHRMPGHLRMQWLLAHAPRRSPYELVGVVRGLFSERSPQFGDARAGHLARQLNQDKWRKRNRVRKESTGGRSCKPPDRRAFDQNSGQSYARRDIASINASAQRYSVSRWVTRPNLQPSP